MQSGIAFSLAVRFNSTAKGSPKFPAGSYTAGSPDRIATAYVLPISMKRLQVASQSSKLGVMPTFCSARSLLVNPSKASERDSTRAARCSNEGEDGSGGRVPKSV